MKEKASTFKMGLFLITRAHGSGAINGVDALKLLRTLAGMK